MPVLNNLKNPWYMKPLNLLHKWFGIVVILMRDTPDAHWMISIYRIRKKK